MTALTGEERFHTVTITISHRLGPNEGLPQALCFKCQMKMRPVLRLFAIVLISGRNSCL